MKEQKKLIRYRLSISRTFPTTHPKAGQEINFVEKIQANDLSYIGEFEPKIHTIRGNYQLWEKRFEKIEKGEAVLELYYWTGKPYNSTCKTFATLKKEDGIGLQYLKFDEYDWSYATVDVGLVDTKTIFPSYVKFAKNDGLSVDDFKAWFKKTNLSEPFAIIHFTKFRY